MSGIGGAGDGGGDARFGGGTAEPMEGGGTSGGGGTEDCGFSGSFSMAFPHSSRTTAPVEGQVSPRPDT